MIIESQYVPDALDIEDGWMQFSIINSIPFNMSGVLASIIQPFAKANISILAVSTFDTDYVFFKKHLLQKTISILEKNNSIKLVYEPETTGVL
ncbi:MAG: ACT domain-containing protein [Chlamydiales bacterium]|nr:ACT domain-containing protein [Chlamydiales bacterium]